MTAYLEIDFLLRLAGIGVQNLLLSGDNALVIALAVRALPRHKRVLGQIWGAAGAVVLRLLFLGVVMYLLEVPYTVAVSKKVRNFVQIPLGNYNFSGVSIEK